MIDLSKFLKNPDDVTWQNMGTCDYQLINQEIMVRLKTKPNNPCPDYKAGDTIIIKNIPDGLKTAPFFDL